MNRQKLVRVMAKRKDSNTSIMAQQDEKDVLSEVGAEVDEETGELVADEKKILEVGAVDAESVIENRRAREAVNKKRAGMKGISFNAGDILSRYESTIKTWPPNTLDIFVKRLTGNPIEHIIQSRPRSGAELYNAIMALHGQSEEAKYFVKFLDNSDREFRGQGNITMPDTRPPTQQGQPMHPYYPPQGYPPGYPPPAPGYAQPVPNAPPNQPAAPPPPPPPPPVVVQAPGQDMGAMIGVVGQMFEMFQRMQPQTPQPTPQTPPQYVPPPPPPPGSDMAAQMAWVSQMFEMFQKMQPGTPAPVHHQPASPPPQPQPTSHAPTTRPPAGMMWAWFPEFNSFALVPAPGVGGSGPAPGPHRPPPYRPPYAQEREAPPSYQGPPPQRPMTPGEQLREAITVVKTAVNMVQEFSDLVPGQSQADPVETVQMDDDSPFKIIDTGAGKIAVNKSDGSMRLWESGFANLGDILKWGGEQVSKINKANAERAAQQQQPRQQLPPGYVEVTPGYRPPPGYVAVPVDVQEQQAPLPPPPENLPPPIQTAPQHTWSMPTIPGEEG